MDELQKKVKIDKLRKQIAVCTRCHLHQTRTHTVPGEGSLDAQIMFIGEAPGQKEDELGMPFVGRAGSVLDKLLASIGLKRDDIYICNILKCRPPENRNPLPDEIHACVGSLDQQIKVIDPVVIATLGKFATMYILEKFGLPLSNISSLAGKVFKVDSAFGPKTIIPLFHPAVAMYDGSKYELLLTDFKKLKTFVKESDACR
jgi:uracil-DNA glycosylase